METDYRSFVWHSELNVNLNILCCYREGQEGTLFSDWPTCWLWHLSQYLCWAGPNCVGQAKLSLQSLSAQLSPNSATVVRLNNQAVARRNGSGQQSRWITHWYWDYYSSSRAALYFFFYFSVFGIFMVGISGSSRHNHTFTVWENHFTLCLALKERRWWEFNIQDSGCSCHWCLTTRRMWVWTSCCLCAHSFFPQSKGMHVMLIGCRYGCDHEGLCVSLCKPCRLVTCAGCNLPYAKHQPRQAPVPSSALRK